MQQLKALHIHCVVVQQIKYLGIAKLDSLRGISQHYSKGVDLDCGLS